MFIVLYGNYRDGYTAVGPFDTADDATSWCDDHEHPTSDIFALTDPDDA